MKKLLLIASSIFISCLTMMSQSSVIVNDFSNGQVPILNNSVLELTATSSEHVTTEINVKNTSNTTKVYKLKRIDDILNPGANAYFCVGGGNCYGPSTTIAPLSVTLTASGTPGDDLYSQNLMYLLDLEEDVTPGISHVRYQIYDENNMSDLFTFTIYYNDVATSVKQSFQSFTTVSGVYPNPSASKAYINVVSIESVNDALVTITNSLGAIISTKKIDLISGKNTVSIDSESLASGIYFATLSSNKIRVVKKFTINK